MHKFVVVVYLKLFWTGEWEGNVREVAPFDCASAVAGLFINSRRTMPGLVSSSGSGQEVYFREDVLSRISA